MINRIMKKICKIGGVFLIMVVGSSFTGCSELGGIKSNSDYKNLALETLEERYGEKFEIKQLGGTFGALNDTKKLVCYPSSNPDKFCFVEVEKDLSDVHDTYINRIMEEKLNEYLTPYAEEIFGEEVKIKSFFDNRYNEYDSLDMSVVDFMNKNNRCSYVLDVFINGGKNIDKSKESEDIWNFANKLLEYNIKNDNHISIWYVKDEEFKNVDELYYNLNFDDNLFEYYNGKSYNATMTRIRESVLKGNKDEIKSDFIY